MKTTISCLIAPLLVCLGLKAQTDISIGETRTFYSTSLGENRQINVYNPHADSSAAQQVIYLLDGSRHEDFLHVVGLVQFMEMMYGMPPTMVVGIENVDRKRDFSFPTTIEADKVKFPTTGGSEPFRSFLINELVPYVDEHFPNSGRRILIGQSLGGLLATEVLFNPSPFDQFIIVSPSLWWDAQSLLERCPLSGDKTRIFVLVGNEGRVMERDAKHLFKLVKKHRLAEVVSFEKLNKENHATILHQALYQVFSEWYPSPY
ncbi:MAG: hypothetical protein RL226_270 [Bacteroidota bacterium]|jgi:predicted alpha/beta superfamily hydrolase